MERDHALLNVGETAPNFTLKTPEGRTISLHDALRSNLSTTGEQAGRPALLVFLRHLG